GKLDNYTAEKAPGPRARREPGAQCERPVEPALGRLQVPSSRFQVGLPLEKGSGHDPVRTTWNVKLGTWNPLLLIVAPGQTEQRPSLAGAAAELLVLVLVFVLVPLQRRLRRGHVWDLYVLRHVRVVQVLARQPNFAILGVNAQDLHLDLVADLNHVLRRLDLPVRQFGDVQQPL